MFPLVVPCSRRLRGKEVPGSGFGGAEMDEGDGRCPQCGLVVHQDAWVRHMQWHAVLDERLAALEARVTELEEYG